MATGYDAPVQDMRFVLNELIDLDRLSGVGDADGLSPDLVDQILDEAARFAREVLAPLNQSGDQQGAQLVNGVVRMPDGFVDCYRQFVEAGWSSVGGDPEFGGQGLPWTLNAVLSEMWQSANMALADGWMLTQGAVELLELHGSDAQKSKYLPKMISGEWAGTMNLTESNAGSDVGALKTKAVRDNGAYRITGTKIFITHGDQDMSENVIHLVLARTPDAPPGVRGISLFLVPKRMVNDDGTLGQHNDLRVVSLEHKMGHNASPTAMMSYGDDGGAVGYLIGEENRGIECMFTMMNSARLNVAIQGVAIAERAYQAAREWARERVQGRPLAAPSPDMVPIIQHPDVRRMLLDMKAQTEAIRALCYSVAEALDLSRGHKDKGVREAARGYLELMTPVAKAWSTDQGFEVASIGVQVHGGMGYIEETGAAQHLRDARITMIYEGTNGIQALDLVRRKLQQDGGAAAARLISDMRTTARSLAENGAPELAAISKMLTPAIDVLESTTDWVRTTFKSDPNVAAAGATAYCRMLGFVAGGWLLGKGALRLAEHSTEDPLFRNSKLQTAQHFAQQYLPQAAALHTAVTKSHETVLAIAEDAL